jgi:hypothetical protein
MLITQRGGFPLQRLINEDACVECNHLLKQREVRRLVKRIKVDLSFMFE